MMQKFLNIIFFVFCIIKTASAQSDSYMVSSINLPNNVQSSVVKSIIQNKNGIIWIGTEKDLLSFNSHLYVSYTERIAALVDDNYHIFSLFQDTENNIFITTTYGMIRYSVAIDSFSVYTSDTSNSLSISNNFVFCNEPDEDNRFWLGAWNGINLFDTHTKKFIHYLPYKEDEYRNNVVESLAKNGDTLWVGTWSAGVLGFNVRSKKFFNPFNEEVDKYLKSNEIKALNIDKQKRLWIGVRGKGVVVYDILKRKLINIPALSKLSSTNITDILIDSNDDVWIATESGLNQLIKEEEMKYYFHSNTSGRSLESSYVTHLYEGNAKNLFIGTVNGINIIDVHQKYYEIYKGRFN